MRRTAWENYADGYLAFKNTYAATLTAAIKQDVFNARARGYASSLHASLEPNNVPVEVFHNLIEVFKKQPAHLAPLLAAAQASALGWTAFTSTISRPR